MKLSAKVIEAAVNANTGHGHVFKRPDGMIARCGGPSMCAQCAKDLAAKLDRIKTKKLARKARAEAARRPMTLALAYLAGLLTLPGVVWLYAKWQELNSTERHPEC